MSNEPRLTAVPAARSRMPLLQIRIALVLGTLLAAALLGVISTVAWMTHRPAPVDLSSVTTYGRGLAEVAVVSWLDGKPIQAGSLDSIEFPSRTPLAHGAVAWDGFTRAALPEPSGLVYERHRFVTTIAGTDDAGEPTWRPVAVSIVVSFPESSRPLISSLPSIEPLDTRNSDKVFDYSDLSTQALPAQAGTEISRWAGYWASDDRDQLKLTTGDQTTGVEYIGLGGFNADTVRVIAALPAGNTAYGSDTWLVRIRLAITGANKYSTETEMDLTVVGASTGIPRIVGWGPAGAGLRGPAETRLIS